MAETLTIVELGRRGDGIAHEAGGDIFVPFTLPGEIVSVSGKGARREPVSIDTRSLDRIEPVCPHFGTCGGCQTQHIKMETYVAWKTGLVSTPIAKAGIELAPDPMVTFETASRRRALFAAKLVSGKLLFGFSGKGSHTLVHIETCPVLVREISNQLAPLRRLAGLVAPRKKPFRMSVLSAESGLDVTLQNVGDLTTKQRMKAIDLTLELGFSRLSLDDEVLVEAQRPEIYIDGLPVTPSPGAFVQAVKDAENQISELVAEHLGECQHVADLYCGVGTFALRLARDAKVYAAESSKASIESLSQAWRNTGGKLKQIDTEIRDLEQRPLMSKELKQKRIDGLVFDPPRAGAEIQARQIANSPVKKIAAVSCNPVTLARDLAILIEGGYHVTRIVPLDQFKFTPHVEVVALLERS